MEMDNSRKKSIRTHLFKSAETVIVLVISYTVSNPLLSVCDNAISNWNRKNVVCAFFVFDDSATCSIDCS